MSTVYRLPPRPVHATVQRNRAVDGLRKEFTHLTNVSSTGARVIYVTGMSNVTLWPILFQIIFYFLSKFCSDSLYNQIKDLKINLKIVNPFEDK